MPYTKFSELPQVTPSGYMFFPVVDPTVASAVNQNKRVTVADILSLGRVVDGPLTITNTGSLVFEGATDDTNETTLTVIDPTADNVVSLPNATTTLAGLSVTQTYTSAQRGAVTALTSATIVTPNFAVSNNFSLTLGHTVTLANPTNLTAGQSGSIVITQGSGTAYTVAYGSNWKFSGGTPTMSVGLGSVSTLVYYVESSSRITSQLLTNVA